MVYEKILQAVGASSLRLVCAETPGFILIYRSLQLSIMVWALLRTVIAASLLAPAALQVQAGLRVEVRPTASLGVRIADVDQAAMKRLKLPQERGVLITAVEDNAPAKQAGLHADDVLWRFRGEDLYSEMLVRKSARWPGSWGKASLNAAGCC